MVVEVWVPGTPVQQGSMIPGRPVKGPKGMRSTMHSHNSAELKAWRSKIAGALMLARGGEVIDPYVDVLAIFHLAKPKTTKYPEYPAGTPDLDKLQRALGDALTESGVIVDDARIVRWHVMEVWAGGRRSSHDEPGVYVQVMPA